MTSPDVLRRRPVRARLVRLTPGRRARQCPPMDLHDLTPAERRVRQAFPTGAEVDFRRDGDDPAEGDAWGPERTVRAGVLRALLLSSPAGENEVPALRISG